MANITVRRRWMSTLLCVLIALSVILHLGTTMPAQADVNATQVVAASDSNPPCESGHHPAAAHCQTTIACSLYAQIEAGPPTFDNGKVRLLPSTDRVPVARAISPQLQPPQHSL
jgi:hypothetical protein